MRPESITLLSAHPSILDEDVAGELRIRSEKDGVKMVGLKGVTEPR